MFLLIAYAGLWADIVLDGFIVIKFIGGEWMFFPGGFMPMAVELVTFYIDCNAFVFEALVVCWGQ